MTHPKVTMIISPNQLSYLAFTGQDLYWLISKPIRIFSVVVGQHWLELNHTKIG